MLNHHENISPSANTNSRRVSAAWRKMRNTPTRWQRLQFEGRAWISEMEKRDCFSCFLRVAYQLLSACAVSANRSAAPERQWRALHAQCIDTLLS